MAVVAKWLDSRICESLAIQGVTLTPEQYENLIGEVDLWLFENINEVIDEKLKEIT